VIQASAPSIRYLSPTSIALFDRVAALRDAGLESYATADAGPNVVALCRAADAEAVAGELGALAETVVALPGPGLVVGGRPVE